MPFIEGVVKDETGTPAARTVRMYDRATGVFLGETTSDPTTGAYQMYAAKPDEVQRVVLDDATTDPLRADLVDRVIPGDLTAPIGNWETASPEGMTTLMAATFHDDLTVGISDFWDLSGGTMEWSGGVLAPNGKIYGIPYNKAAVLEIDPATDTVAQIDIAEAALAKWRGGVLAPNGKIYGIPYDATTVLEFDPETGTHTTFGSFSAGENKWSGGVLAPNGKIYGIPWSAASVLVIDPVAKTATTFGNLGTALSKWAGGCLASNGSIYAAPFSVTQVLEINPVTGIVSSFGDLGSDYKWQGTVAAPNGNLYGIPYSAGAVLEIDPVLRTTNTFGSGISSYGYRGGALAPNGKIYAPPFGGVSSSNRSFLEIDPAGSTVTEFGVYSAGDGAQNFTGLVLAENGSLYAIPFSAPSVAKITFSPDPSARLSQDMLLNPMLNKF